MNRRDADDLKTLLADWRRSGRDIKALLARKPADRSSRTATCNVIVRETITARVGRKKGKGKVDVLRDKRDGTDEDEIVRTDVEIRNPTLTTIEPSQTSGKDRQIIAIEIDGMLQVVGGDCPV